MSLGRTGENTEELIAFMGVSTPLHGWVRTGKANPMVLKDLTPAERQAAREKALEARTTRAKIKADFALGKLSLSDVFEQADHHEAVARMRTVDLLTSLKGIGEIRAQSIMEECEISLNRRLRGLGHRQRSALQAALGR